MSPIDWAEWHEAYDDPDNPLARRLRTVQTHIRAALDAAPPGPVRAISVCAGQGTDLLGVLADHPRAGDVTGRLVELDPRNTAAIDAPPGIEVVTGDASLTDAYAGAVPADLVLVCGVLGRVDHLGNLVRVLPQLCATGGVVIWTRHRRPPDRTPRVRRLLARAAFEEIAFDAPEDEHWTVGSHRHAGEPPALQPGVRLWNAFRS